MKSKINFQELETGKLIPEVWHVTCGVVRYKKDFNKLNDGLYDTSNSGFGIYTYLDNFFTSELEAFKEARAYKLEALQEVEDRIKELEKQADDKVSN